MYMIVVHEEDEGATLRNMYEIRNKSYPDKYN